ncbi:GFA family protein [Primorskyibacter aestuariivivens]
MTEDIELRGQCMCGSVQVRAVSNRNRVAVCHCDMCRRWSSGPFMSVNCGEVAFNDEGSVRRIRSSDWAERGFCRECGSNLFYRIVGQTNYQMAAGIFNNQDQFRMALQVFVDEKPSYYSFSELTKCMTAAEVLAIQAPK